MSESAQLESTEAAITSIPTPLALHLASDLRMHAGALTPQSFSGAEKELASLLRSSAVFDLGYRTRIQITGEDRLRWLNGMVSNAIQSLPEGHGNYNFILNAQGRIQGDAYIYRRAGDLLLDTDRSQAGRLLAHLDHFIIMDDVELHHLDHTGIGLAGPQSLALLDGLGLPASRLEPMGFAAAEIGGVPVTLIRAYSVLVPRFELWFAPENTAAVWNALTSAGAAAAGIAAIESLRVLEGIPRFGIDFTDRHLAQETSQTRALNFTKGCYLGQEIVERIRSRATVHRHLRQLLLHGVSPELPADLGEDSAKPIGQITSVARIPGQLQALAIGFVRAEAIERKTSLVYPGGNASILDRPISDWQPALPEV